MPARFPRRFVFVLLLLPTILPGFAAPVTFPGEGRKWRYYQSPNFELYSYRSDAISRDLLERMELLRALFLETFKLPVRLPQPVTIFAFDAMKDFNGYLPPNRQGSAVYHGFCLAQPDRTVITLAPTGDEEATARIVYHEYIHVLFQMTEQTPPPWFNEGAAEVFSTLDEDKKSLILGNPVVGRVLELRQNKLMSFEQLFAVTYDSPLFKNSGHTGLFYAQSWAFMHYLKFGVHKIPAENISLFLRVASSSKVQERPAEFRKVFIELLGGDYAKFERELDRYVDSGSFQGRKAPRPQIVGKQEYTARAATAGEMHVRLAELSVRFLKSPYANLALRGQLERQPEARLHEVLASTALQENEADVAREHLLRAVELGTANIATYRELSRLEANLVFRQFNLDYRLPDERAKRLREMLHKSLAAAPTQSNAYEMLAWVEATAHQPDIATVNLVQRQFADLNDRPRTLLALVMVRMRLGQKDDALALLNQLDLLEPGDWVRFCAEVTRARLENRPVDPERLPRSLAQNRSGVLIMPPKLELPR